MRTTWRVSHAALLFRCHHLGIAWPLVSACPTYWPRFALRAPLANLPVNLARNAEGLGAHVIRSRNVEELSDPLVAASEIDRTVVLHVPVDRYEGVPGYEGWWDVPVAEVSESNNLDAARQEHARGSRLRRWHV